MILFMCRIRLHPSSVVGLLRGDLGEFLSALPTYNLRFRLD